MADRKTIEKIVNQPDPVGPVSSANLKLGRDVLIILAGVSTIWTCFQQGGLAEVYNWLNSIQGAPFLSLTALGLLMASGYIKRLIDRKFSIEQHATIKTIANASREEAIQKVHELREASPAAPPIKGDGN